MDIMDLREALPFLLTMFTGLTVTCAVGELRGDTWPFSRPAWLCGLAAQQAVLAIGSLAR